MFSSMRIVALLLAVQNLVNAFAPQHNKSPLPSSLASSTSSDNEAINSRRNFINTISSAAVLSTITSAMPAYADEEEAEVVKTVQTPLYYILRVREATEQETRLIKSGKFKDVQRANVKLAVKFMVDNYRLNDNFIAASAYLEGDKRLKAGDIGTNVVQNLYTILEYFDASDVQNIKVCKLNINISRTKQSCDIAYLIFHKI